MIDKSDEELEDMAKNIIEWKDGWALKGDDSFTTKSEKKYVVDELWKKQTQYSSYFSSAIRSHVYELQNRLINELEDESMHEEYIKNLQEYLKLDSYNPTPSELFYLAQASPTEKLIAIHRTIKDNK